MSEVPIKSDYDICEVEEGGRQQRKEVGRPLRERTNKKKKKKKRRRRREWGLREDKK